MNSSTHHQSAVVLLGPQRHTPSVRDAHALLVPTDDPRPVAAITAGWEEREHETEEFATHLDREVQNLALHRRALEAFDTDPDLLAGVQACHDQLTQQQKLYRLQLRHLGRAARALLERAGDADVLAPHQETAFANLQNLDADHLRRIQDIRATSAENLELQERESLQRVRDELSQMLEGASALCIAGGHVGILFNRLWMFGIADLLPPSLPLIAWSAGAMSLTRRIVLFHDNPPEGAGRAEVLGPGLGLVPDVVLFPHAAKRLHTEDTQRVQLLSRRFAPDRCLALDDGAEARFDGQNLEVTGTTRQLIEDGTVTAAGGV